MEKSSFFLNRDIEKLISDVETAVINELEGGNRQAGMKRLKVDFVFTTRLLVDFLGFEKKYNRS